MMAQLEIHMEETWPKLHTKHRNQFEVNCRSMWFKKTIQLLKYTIQESLHTIRVRKDISNRTQKAVTIKK